MFTSNQEILRRWGADTVAQYCDDDRDGEADDAVLTEVAADANRDVESFLLGKGLTHAQLSVLARDETIRRAASAIAGEIMGLRRVTLIRADGTTLFTPPAVAVRQTLTQIATAERRVNAERADGGGASSNLTGQTFTPEPVFEVAPSAAYPRGRGGF